jgi:hypothetical protein
MKIEVLKKRLDNNRSMITITSALVVALVGCSGVGL